MVVARVGGTAVVTPAGDIFGAFERGVIDAAEWVGPHDDMKLGLQNTARYYYYPGWHEPGTVSDFGFNAQGVRGAPGRPQAHPRSGRGVDPGPRQHGVPHEERRRARAPQDGVQGQGRAHPVPGGGPAGPQEGRDRGDPGAIREESHGPEGERVVRQVPGDARPLGRSGRGLLPPAASGSDGPAARGGAGSRRCCPPPADLSR